MPKTKIRFNKRYLQVALGLIAVALVLALLLFSYPWIQLRIANGLLQSGEYEQAEKIYQRLVEAKPHWIEPVSQLVICQTHMGKGRQAATNVLSLADMGSLEDMEIATIFLDVGNYLLNTGNGDIALSLTRQILTLHDEAMMQQAAIEIGLSVAEYYDLPLALDAVNLVLELADDNWILERKAYDLLLPKALGASEHAEPALNRALELDPYNIFAVSRKASLISSQQGPKAALDYLVQQEPHFSQEMNQEYLNTKRGLISQLISLSSTENISKYTRGMPEGMIVDIALQGLGHAHSQGLPGHEFYNIADFSPQVSYQYASNLYLLGLWQQAKDVFVALEQLDAEYSNFAAIHSALDSQLYTQSDIYATSDYVPDNAYISPDGNWLAWSRWEQASDGNHLSNLVVTNLNTNETEVLDHAILLQWSSDSDYLAYITISGTGRGRLHIYSVAEQTLFSLPRSHDVISFNWAEDSLMVQANIRDEIRLLELTEQNPEPEMETTSEENEEQNELELPEWEIVSNSLWELNSSVNPDFAWLSVDDRQLSIHRRLRVVQEFTLDDYLISFTQWSPSGNTAIVEDATDRGWIYDYRQQELREIEVQGRFADWGQGDEFYWYVEVWDQVYTLARMDSEGKIIEYLPYSFTAPHFDVSITADGSKLVLTDNNEIIIFEK